MTKKKTHPENLVRPPTSMLRRDFLVKSAAAAGGLLVWTFPGLRARAEGSTAPTEGYDWNQHYWGYAVDTTKCVGCNACARACRAENGVPAGNHRTWVERYEIDDAGEAHVDVASNVRVTFDGDELTADRSGKAPLKAFFVPKLCNHCEKSVCTQVCPVGASFSTKDGVVMVDPGYCIGCGYCVQACPYGSRFMNAETHMADKCTLCYHRITKGLKPACVQSCPVGARIFGDLKDPHSDISRVLKERRYTLLKPEMGTHPKCYYIGLDQEVI
ncbi:MAG: 4Fe-4S dicluster domain-containing protein [Pseudomonadota bacterium]